MSRTDKDIPWTIKHKNIYGVDWEPQPFHTPFRYNGYLDNYLGQTTKDYSSERASMRDYTSHLKNFYNTFGEMDEDKLEPQTPPEYVH